VVNEKSDRFSINTRFFFIVYMTDTRVVVEEKMKTKITRYLPPDMLLATGQQNRRNLNKNGTRMCTDVKEISEAAQVLND